MSKVLILLAFFLASFAACEARSDKYGGLLKAESWCGTCVNWLGASLNELVQTLLDGGVGAGCGEACGQLQAPWETSACMLMCDYVGIGQFAKLIEIKDPTPIYICQEWYMCGWTAGGVVNDSSVSASIKPAAGRAGTTFEFALSYQVVSTTSVGNIVYEVTPPFGLAFGDKHFVEEREPGVYTQTWSIDTSGDDEKHPPWAPGLYKVKFAICAGDCSNNHKFSGVYSVEEAEFKILP